MRRLAALLVSLVLLFEVCHVSSVGTQRGAGGLVPPTTGVTPLKTPRWDRLIVPHAPTDLCPVQFAEAMAAKPTSFLEVSNDPAQSDQGGPAPDQVLKSVCHYAGLGETSTLQSGAIKAELTKPENIAFRRVASHFFSCVDPRSEYAVLATLGGDTGEFIIALSVAEKVQKRPWTMDDVNTLFQDYLRLMLTRGKTFFYMHTDEAAQAKLATAAGVKNAASPQNTAERNRIISEAIKPDHVGCQHLKGMLSDAAGYGVRKEIVEWMLQVYLNIYFDVHNPLRENLLYVVSKGEPVKGSGNARIWSPDECVGIAPALVPNTGTSKTVIHHDAHVRYFRQDLARFFAFKNAMLDANLLLAEMDKVAKLQHSKISVYTDAPEVDIIFKSVEDRWPF